METRNDRTAVIALIAGGIALLLGLCLGALGGGAAGFLIGRQAGERAGLRDVLPSNAIEGDEAPSLRPETPELPALPSLPGLLGGSGALIREVAAGSPAEKAGLKVGDVITGVNEISINTDHPLATVVSSFQPGDRVELRVVRNGKTLALNLTLGESSDKAKQAYMGVYYVDLSALQQQPGD